jgi:hypothetical protein
MIDHPSLLGGLLTRKGGWRESALPLAAVVVTGLGVASFSDHSRAGAPEGLVGVAHAGNSSTYDYDSDGLTNLTEKVLGSSEYIPDTDGDGFSDLEEFTRNSDVGDPNSVPLPSDLNLAMSASGEHDGLHLQIGSFFTDNDYGNKNFEVGVVINGEIRLLPELLSQPGIAARRSNSQNGAGSILLLDVPFPESLVHSVGELSVFVTLNVTGSPVIDAAAGIKLASHDSVVMIVQPGPLDRYALFQASARPGSGGGGSTGGSGISGASTGSVYNPIPPGGGGVPNTWTPGEICFQAAVEIGNDNGVISHEVVAADCITGWDSHCRSDCSSSVGSTFQTFDPLGLVGG